MSFSMENKTMTKTVSWMSDKKQWQTWEKNGRTDSLETSRKQNVWEKNQMLVSSKAMEESERYLEKILRFFNEYLTSNNNWNKIIMKAASIQTSIVTSWLFNLKVHQISSWRWKRAFDFLFSFYYISHFFSHVLTLILKIPF